MARKTDLNQQVIEQICANVSLGMPNRDAAALAGFDESTFYKWRRKGQAELDRLEQSGTRPRKSMEIYVLFVQALMRATPKRKQRLLGAIQQAISGHEWIEPKHEYRINANGERYLYRVTETKKYIPPDWRAALTLLERLHPDEYGVKAKLEVMWMDKVGEMLHSNEVTPEEVIEEFGDAAFDIFRRSGIQVLPEYVAAAQAWENGTALST